MIASGRTLVADTFIDEGVIRRPNLGPPALDTMTGVSTPAAPTTVYTGRCRIKRPSTEEMTQIFGDTDVSVQRRIVRVPFDTVEVRKDDVFTATSSGDAEVLRQDMRVSVVVAGSMNMYRDYGVEVIE